MIPAKACPRRPLGAEPSEALLCRSALTVIHMPRLTSRASTRTPKAARAIGRSAKSVTDLAM
eukprot:6722915-Pyramimonas_sp.AAC.1